MGNRFGIQGLGAEAVHSIRDVNDARISEVSRPTEVSLNVNSTKESIKSEFGTSCPDTEDVRKAEFASRYSTLDLVTNSSLYVMIFVTIFTSPKCGPLKLRAPVLQHP